MKVPTIISFCSVAAMAIFAVGAPEQIRGAIAAIQNVADSNLDPDVRALKAAIIQQESGGNSGAKNPHSSALGLGQVMPENVPSWSKAALGKSISAQEFLASPDLQHKIINHKILEYWQIARAQTPDKKQAVRCVAAMWYSGQCKLKDSYNSQSYNGHSYPSIGNYADKAYEKYKKFGGTD